MARKTTTRNSPKGQLALAAVTGPSGALSYSRQSLKERPAVNDLNSIFTRCRTVATESSFLSIYLPLKQAFYNYGFSVALGPNAKGDDDALNKWLAEEFTTDAEYTDPKTNTTVKLELNQTRSEAIAALVADVWREFLLFDNVVLQWFDGGSRAPVTLALEACRYSDKLGLPVLYYTHGLSREEIALLPQDQQARFTEQPEVLLSPDEGEHFKVLKRGLAGSGFVVPKLYSLLRTLGEIDAKEAGCHGQAFNMRAATRHFKVGHEIKYNAPAATHAQARWSAVTDKRIRLEFKDRQGPHDFTSNFDTEISFPWPDAERFDEVIWKGTDRRCRNWGGPVAQMLISESVVEGGLNFLRAMANEDRAAVAALVRPAIAKVFSPPENLDLQLVWSDLIFNNPAQAAELLKFAAQSGMASWTTAARMIGLNPDREAALKLREADDPDKLKKYLPAFDMSHGTAPALGILELGGASASSTPAAGKGADPGKKNGRPTGSSSTTTV